MTCLSERMIGVLFFTLSGYAFAERLAIDSPETVTVANIAPLPMEVVPPIPEPQRHLRSYGMEYQSKQAKPYYAQIEDYFYSAKVTQDYRLGAGTDSPTHETPSQQASNFLRPGASTAPQISIVQLPNITFTLGAQPQRRLSLTIDTWAFSATARLAVLHSHDTGATLSVRHGF
ncbi:hypothetical protein AWB67_07167 [Caballeronia terrestris]|uniref:Uncharacterized protein n=1 Tax=Caballeronia terrestris TaxID=1226301 RepID=A0A158L011_9BURK|nr:hypothetical protein AWB67_07167 [Caballeronia terrestris]